MPKAISGDLPANGPALAFAEDHVNPDLLFVGTEFGLFFTVDGGQKWTRLRSNLPTIPGRDLAIQEGENDLVLATFGRGFYVLDDYSPLRQVKSDILTRDAHVFPVSKATIEVPETGKIRASQGEQLYMAENPALGAVITYWLKDAVKTSKQQRQEAAREAEQKKETPKYPSQAELTSEADEDAPQILLTITDPAGRIVRRMGVAGTRGIHRVTWNLRGTPVSGPAAGPAVGRRGAGGGTDITEETAFFTSLIGGGSK